MGFCPKDQKSLETGEQTQVTQVRVSDCSLLPHSCPDTPKSCPGRQTKTTEEPAQPPRAAAFPKRVWQEGLGSVSRGSASLLPCPFQDTTATQWRPISNKG